MLDTLDTFNHLKGTVHLEIQIHYLFTPMPMESWVKSTKHKELHSKTALQLSLKQMKKLWTCA